ncbi:MAG: pilus assembly protein PilP [Betaproteobacteria bacterium]|nr:pilus assembly protein PilP [Betaproteobacteria bacterium]
MRARNLQGLLRLGAVLVVAGLLGCGGANQDDLTKWISQQKNQTRPRVPPLAEPKQFQPQAYAPASALDPFSSQQLTQALKRDGAPAGTGTALLAGELTRRKEALEAVPLDAMALVGTMVRAGQPVALVKSDRLIYQIRPGHHLGQNYGRVVRITETELTLREVVQDATGDWVERTVSLQLQEKLK